MVYITGNIHGDLERFTKTKIKKLRRKDTLIICGDFGFVWDGNAEEGKVLKWLGKRRYKILFVEGAHENFERLATFPEVVEFGGRVRQLGKNLFQAIRGEIYTIDDNRILAFGGGDLDSDEDAIEGVNWLVGEQISPEDQENLERNLHEKGSTVDYIVTHDPPLKMKEFLTIHTGEEHQQNSVFDYINENVSYKQWFFGHYHMDKVIASKYVAIYQNLTVLPIKI